MLDRVRAALAGFEAAGQAARNLAVTQEPLVEPGSIEMPATTAGDLFQLSDFKTAAGRGGWEYAALLVTNGSGDTIRLLNDRNMSVLVYAGQTFEWAQPPGVKWAAVKPTATTTAGQVVITPKLRSRGA